MISDFSSGSTYVAQMRRSFEKLNDSHELLYGGGCRQYACSELDRTDRLLTVTVDGSGVIATLIRVVEWSIF